MTACASSVLPNQSGNSYDVANLFDGRLDTAWVEGVRGTGLGQSVTLEFPQPRAITTLLLRNGYLKSDRTYSRNARVRRLVISTSRGDGYVTSTTMAGGRGPISAAWAECAG